MQRLPVAMGPAQSAVRILGVKPGCWTGNAVKRLRLHDAGQDETSRRLSRSFDEYIPSLYFVS